MAGRDKSAIALGQNLRLACHSCRAGPTSPARRRVQPRLGVHPVHSARRRRAGLEHPSPAVLAALAALGDPPDLSELLGRPSAECENASSTQGSNAARTRLERGWGSPGQQTATSSPTTADRPKRGALRADESQWAHKRTVRACLDRPYRPERLLRPPILQDQACPGCPDLLAIPVPAHGSPAPWV